MTIFLLIGTVFVIISEIFHGRISLNSVLLLLLRDFVSGLRLEFMYISLTVSFRSNLSHLHDFQQLALLPQLIDIIFFFVCTSRINLLNLKEQSGRLVIVAKVFWKLPNFHMLLKQKRPSLPRHLALDTFCKLLIVLSTKINLLYFLSSTNQRCCKAKLFA